MPSAFEHQESTLVWDHDSRTVELYTTSRRVWLRAIARNPNTIKALDLGPGYLATWKMTDVKGPEMAIKPAPGGDEAVERYLTDAEKQARLKASQRMHGIRAARSE